jgi:hypothetical protein
MNKKILECTVEDTKLYTFKIAKDGVPVNITGWTIFFTVKQNYSDSDVNAKIAKVVVCPANSDSTNGIGYVSLTITDTNLPVGKYVYDFKFQKPDLSYRETFLWGDYRINPTAKQGTV